MTDLPTPHEEMMAGPEPDAAPNVGAWGAIVKVLYSPADVFALVRARRPWFPPYFFMGLFMAVSAVIAVFASGDMMNEQFATMPELADAGMDASGLTMIGAVFGGFFGFFTPAIIGVMFTLTLYVFGLIFNSRATFGELFALSGYAEIPAMLATVLSIVLLIVIPEQALTFDLSFSVLWPEAPRFLATLLGMLSPFTIWTWLLIAAGLHRLSGLSAGQARGLTLTVFVIIWLTRFAFGSLGSALMNFAPGL